MRLAISTLLLTVSLHAQELRPYWTGYVSVGEQFDWVSAEWDVPTIKPNTTAPLLIWVGLDGYLNHQVEQCGTESLYEYGQQVNYAWFEFYPARRWRVNLNLLAGDHVQSGVFYNYGTWILWVENTTRNQCWVHWFVGIDAPRSSAEWIVEGYAPPLLPEFTPITFTDCITFGGGFIGGLNEPWWGATKIEDVADHGILVSTGSNDTFTVNDAGGG